MQVTFRLHSQRDDDGNAALGRVNFPIDLRGNGQGSGQELQNAHPTRVLRRRVLAHLRAAEAVPIVVLTAPAGSGKSITIAQWAEIDGRRCEMVRLAPHLDNAAALATRIAEVLDAVGPAARGTRMSITAVEPEFSAVVLPGLAALAASRSQPYLLVLDDVQVLTDPCCDQVLAAVCDGVPPGSQVVLMTRRATPEWLSRARAEDRLVEIDARELAFDVEEAASLFDRVGTQVLPADVPTVVDQYEGWAVGLYLAAVSRRGQAWTPSAAGVPTPRESRRHVLDYVRAEVLAAFDEDTQAFLRRTSIVEELTPALCDALLRRRGSAAVLTQIHRDNQLVVGPASADGGHYRYHHLLLEALREELLSREPEMIPELHKRVASWYWDTGDLDAAIRHATAAGDWSALSRFVWAGVPGSLGSGHPDRLTGWLRPISDRRLAEYRWLSLAAAFQGLQIGDEDRMTRWLLRSEAHVGPDWQARADREPYAASLAVLHCLVGVGGLERTYRLAVASTHGLPADSPFRTPAFFLAGVIATLCRRDEEGRSLLIEAERLSRALGVPIVEADSLSWQGVATGLAGDWQAAGPLLDRAAVIIDEAHLDRLATAGHVVTAQALGQAVRGRKTQARATLAKARRLSALMTGITPWFAVYGPLVQARTALLLGETDTARTLYLDAKLHMTADLAETLLEDLRAEVQAELTKRSADGIPSVALTTAEMHVLQYMPSHLTFRQIGENLFIAPTTVKSHALSIYRKLGVRSRDEAVTRARSMGLVGSLRLD
ncbi:MAG: LuxR C-terminal-related transcriptional regulator [Dermatophilaceae bacterium]